MTGEPKRSPVILSASGYKIVMIESQIDFRPSDSIQVRIRPCIITQDYHTVRHMTFYIFLGGLFGNNANKPATGGGLFGNTNNTFGNNNQNKSGGGMFGNNTSGGFGTSNTSGNREKFLRRPSTLEIEKLVTLTYRNPRFRF